MMAPLLLCIIIIFCNIFIPGCNSFATPPSSTKVLLQQHATPSPSSSSLKAIPIDEIIKSASTTNVLSQSASALLYTTDIGSGINMAAARLIESNEPILTSLLHIPTLWSILAMTSIVALLVAWEEAIENIRHNTPKPLMPVIDSMLAEVGGLGFIGLFLSTLVTGGPLGQVVASLSDNYLGHDELLLETFEFLHTFFFQVGILFFAIAGIVVGAVLKDVQSLQTISEMSLDADGDGEVTLDELADALQVESMIIDLDGDGIISDEEMTKALRSASTNINSFQNFFDEWNKSEVDFAGENLVLRERMMDKMKLPQTFAIEDYFAQIFGHNLKEVVKLSPVTWLPLIPLIAVDNTVDLSRDVVSASSSNAFDSCGFFYATPWVLYSTIVLQFISLVWSTFNYWKLSSIKQMLLPTLIKEHAGSEAVLLPPRYEDKVLLDKFNSSPSIFEWGEQFFTGGGSKTYPPRNEHEKLFGASGSKFPSILRDSIQFHTWLSVTLIVYSTTQIIFRDAAALYLGADVGSPDTIVPELVLWSAFLASTVFQLSLAPTTFLNYCFVTSIEEFVKIDIVKKSIVFEEENLNGLWKNSVASSVDESKIRSANR